MQNEDYYKSLCIAYFEGRISKQDQALLKAWLAADRAHRTLMRSWEQEWTAQPSSMSLTDASWQRFEQLRNSKSNSQSPSSQSHDTKSPSLSNRSLWMQRIGYCAAAVCVLVLMALPFVKWFENNRGGGAVRVFADRVMEYYLPDSTFVRLQTGAELCYDAHYGKSSREVHLKGEAYFEVRRNPACPFRATANNAVVEVLGTCFTITAYPDKDSSYVVLHEGKVALHYADTTYIMAPGDEVLWVETSRLARYVSRDTLVANDTTLAIDTLQSQTLAESNSSVPSPSFDSQSLDTIPSSHPLSDETALTDDSLQVVGKMRYTNQSLDFEQISLWALLEHLSRFYGREIVYDASAAIMQETLHFSLPKDQTFEQAVEAVASVYGLSVRYGKDTCFVAL